MLQGGIGLWGFARKDPSQAGDGLLCRGVVFFQLGSTWDFVPCHIYLLFSSLLVCSKCSPSQGQGQCVSFS